MDVYIKSSDGELEHFYKALVDEDMRLHFNPSEAATYVLVYVPLEEVVIDEEIAVNRGTSYRITPTFVPENATNRNVIFYSSDTYIFTIDSNGYIEPIIAGEATLRMNIVEEAIEKEILIIVNNIPEEIILQTDSVRLQEGQNRVIAVEVIPADAVGRELIWVSSDEDIVTVDENGRITAHKIGSAEIGVRTSFEPAIYRTIKVEVIARQVPATPTGGSGSGGASNVAAPTFINGIMIVNRQFGLPRNFSPGVNAQALTAFNRMRDSAARQGLTLRIVSGFRSYETQRAIWDRNVRERGEAEASRWIARPGHSEHQTGLAFDINSTSSAFANTPEGRWLAANAHNYGFIIRYPAGTEHITGFAHEPWHIRYVGHPTSVTIFERGVTLEEFLGLH